MADNETTETETQETEETTTKETSGQKRTVDQLSAAEQNQYLVALMADERVQDIIRAEQQGKRVKVVAVDDEGESEETSEESLDLGDLDGEADSIVKAVSKVLDKRLGPISKDVDQLKALAQTVQQDRVVDQVKAAQAKHKDLDKYKTEMAKIVRENNLDIESAYFLAKQRAGDLQVAEPSTESEKPTATPRRRLGAREKKGGEGLSQRRRWQVSLADALEKL